MAIELPLIVPGIRLATGDPSVEIPRAIERARRPWVAGFCLFGGERAQVTDLVGRLREAAGRPIFVASDMECGAGQQVQGLRMLPEAAVWGLAGGPAEIKDFARITAEDALSVGVDVLFAPVLDVMSEPRNPIVGARAFGWDPGRVATLGVGYLRGVLEAGAIPVAKHFPGHGATDVDSHQAVPVVLDDREVIERRDLVPFRAALASRACPALMTAHVSYPSLDATGTVATLSRPILDSLRATPGGADVVVFTDALCMDGVRGGRGEPEAGRLALAAGCDLLLCPDDPEAVAEGLAEVPVESLEPALRRAEAFAGRVTAARRLKPARGELAADMRAVDEVARRAVAMSFSGARETEGVLVLDDDGVPTRGAHIEDAARRGGVAVRIVRPPFDGVQLGEASTVVVMASIRAWKGGRLSPAGQEAAAALRAEAEAAGRPLRFVWMGALPDRPEAHVPGTAVQVERALVEALLPARA